MERTLRAAIGLGIGIALAIVLPDYFGLSLVFFSYWRNGLFSGHEADVYMSLSAFCALASLLIGCLAILLLLEFLRPRSRLRHVLTMSCLAGASGIAIVHLLAYRTGWIHSELHPLPALIDSHAMNGWLILGAVAGFAFLIGRPSDDAKAKAA
jgi:hypothetical protein